MILVRDRFGQLSPAEITASTPEVPLVPGFKLSDLFFISVAAGVTVWIITRFLDGRSKR